MATPRPVSGMKFWIGGVLAKKTTPFVASDFAAISWVQVNGWKTMGQVGDSSALITTPLIDTARDDYQKGTAAAPAQTMSFIEIIDDAGQLALIAAGQPTVKDTYAVRIDGNETGGSTPSYRYYIALIMGTPEAGGEANTALLLNVNVQPCSNIVRVAPT
jgi:hypothetical protein